jgi:LPXTG-site transpeptidase (sortase) family protein
VASRGGRSLVAVAVISVVVIVAAGLAIALSGGGAGPAGSPTPFTNTSDLPLVTPRPTIVASLPPVVTASPAPSPSLTPGPGIRAERIQIERLGIDLPIVEGDGIDAPLGKAAHYPGTGWPDAGTNIYLYGHARTGMFLALWDVAVGDQVVLTLVDGTERTYVVAEVIPEVPWNALTYLDPTPTEQLTLQTSTSYQATSPRFIAIAHPTP